MDEYRGIACESEIIFKTKAEKNMVELCTISYSRTQYKKLVINRTLWRQKVQGIDELKL